MKDDKVPVLHANERSISHNARLKNYPDGSWELLVSSRPIFRESGWEDPKHDEIAAERRKRREIDHDLLELGWTDEPEPVPEEQVKANIQRAARRAASALRDLALCNDFRWFVTLTLDRDRIDRYDVKQITHKLNQWLDNQVRRIGLKYVLVAERHQDGAIHFHGFINEVPGLVPSGTWKVPGHKKPIRPRSRRQAESWAAQGAEAGFHEVFNWERWPLGFTTAIRLYGDYHAAVSYVCKYIRKQQCDVGGKIGGRWYYSGGDLARPEVVLYDYDLQTAAEQPGSYRFDVPEAGLVFCMVRGTYPGGDDQEHSSVTP